MRVSDVVDRSFAIIRREWRAAVVIGVVLVVGVGTYTAVALVAAWSVLGPIAESGEVGDLEEIVALVPLWIFIGIGILVLSIALMVANGVAVRAGVRGPEEGTSWDGLVPHVGPAAWASLRLLGWSLVVGVAITGLFVAMVALLAVTGESVAVVAIVLLAVGFILGSLAVAPIVSVAFALVYAEERPVVAAVRETMVLVRGRYWPTLGAVVILWLFSLVPVVGSLLVSVLTPSYQAALLMELRGEGTAVDPFA